MDKNGEERVSALDGIFREGLKIMRDAGVPCVTLSVYEADPSSLAFNNWQERPPYYQFEKLSEEEKEMILNKKTYVRYALVLGGVDISGVRSRYGKDSIEIIHRTWAPTMLCPVVPESSINYFSCSGLMNWEEALRTILRSWLDFNPVEARKLVLSLVERQKALEKK